MNSLGAFENTSGTLVVSDPCYTLSDWCLIQLQNVKKGTWNAYVKYSDEGQWGTRCAEIMALRELLPLTLHLEVGASGFVTRLLP